MSLQSTSSTASAFERTLAWVEHTLGLQERPRPDIHGGMLRLADPKVIAHTSRVLTQ